MNYLQVYIQEVSQVYQSQNATEHSYRPALKRLIESLDSGIQAINEPKLDRIYPQNLLQNFPKN